MTKLLFNKGSLGCILVLLLVGMGFTQESSPTIIESEKLTDITFNCKKL